MGGRKPKKLIEEGLRLVPEVRRKSQRKPGLADLMKRAQGIIDSGVPDLASNPEHLTGFGRNHRGSRSGGLR
jgi:hypothetical protein